MKKLLSILTSLLLVASVGLTGCKNNENTKTSSPSPSASNKPVTITLWTNTATAERNAEYKTFGDEIHKKYPNITLDYLGVPGDLAGYIQKVNMAIAAGSAPDITNLLKSAWINSGFYLPLDSYFDKWADKGQINPEFIKSARSYDSKSQKLYGMPYSTTTWNLWVRPDWLKAANLAIPTTWDDYFTDIKTLTDKSKGTYGMSIRGGAGGATALEMLMYSYSGITNYFDKDGKSTINDPSNVTFVEKYLGAYDVYSPQDDLTKGWTELAATFQSGKSAIIMHNLGSASSMVKTFGGDTSKFAAAPMPKSIKGYLVQPGLGSNSMSISASSKNPQEAFAVITEFCSKDYQITHCKTYGEIPSNTLSSKDPFFQDTQYMKVGVDITNPATTKFLDTPYYLPAYSSVQTQMEPLIQKVMTKKMTAKDLLDQWAQAMEKAKSEYDASLKGASTTK